MAELTKREQVRQCIEKGNMTKADIVEELSMSAGSVSTQMTYLRWMDNYIMIDPDTKCLYFTDKETFEAFEADKKANKKTKSTSSKTPEERAITVAKTITNQTATLAKWQAKVVETAEVLETLPDDENAILNAKEAEAMVILTEVKLARNNALADTLPEPVEPAVEESTVEESDEESEDLL